MIVRPVLERDVHCLHEGAEADYGSQCAGYHDAWAVIDSVGGVDFHLSPYSCSYLAGHCDGRCRYRADVWGQADL